MSTSLIIPFGKYRGCTLEHVFTNDFDYLVWLIESKHSWSARYDGIMNNIIAATQSQLDAYHQRKQQLQLLRKAPLEPIIKILKAAVMKDAIKRGHNISEWTQNIITSLEQGNVLSEKAQSIITHMCGKASGRRNSKKYIEVTTQVQQAFQTAEAITLNNDDGTHG